MLLAAGVQAQPAAEASLLSGKAPYGTFLRDLLAMVRGRSDLGRELLCCSPLVLQRLLHSMQLAEYKTQALLVLCISLIRAGPRQDEQFVEVLLQPACLQQLAWALTDSNMQQQRLIARMLGMLAACCCAVPAHVGNIMHALLNADSRLPAGGAALEVARAVPGKLLQALLVDRLLVLRLVSVMEAGRQQWARWAMVWGEAARAAPPAAMQQLVLQLLPCSMAVRGGGSILWLLAADAAPLAVLQALLSSQQGVRAVVKVGGESVLLRLLGAAVAAGDKRLGCSLVRALAAVLADRDAGVVAMAERVLRASVHVLSSCAEVCGELVLCLLEAVVGGRGAAAAAACGVLQHAITASSRCRATLLASSQLGALCKTRHGISVLRTLAIRPSGQQALLPLMGRLLAAALRSEDSSAVAATMMLVEHIAHGSAGGRLMATQHVGELLQMALRQLPAVGRVCACSVLASLLSSHLASLLPHLDTLFEAAVHHPAALVKWWAGYVLGHMAVLSVEAKEFLADPGRMDLLAGLLLDGSATAMDRNHALSLVSSALAAAADLLAGGCQSCVCVLLARLRSQVMLTACLPAAACCMCRCPVSQPGRHRCRCGHLPAAQHACSRCHLHPAAAPARLALHPQGRGSRGGSCSDRHHQGVPLHCQLPAGTPAADLGRGPGSLAACCTAAPCWQRCGRWHARPHGGRHTCRSVAAAAAV